MKEFEVTTDRLIQFYLLPMGACEAFWNSK